MNSTSAIKVETQDEGHLRVNTAFATLLRHNKIETASDLWDLESEPVKNAVRTRGTGRTFLKDPTGGKDIEVYIKRYLKPSLKDRIKCATSFKPIFPDGALHEWRALCRFHELGLKTMVPMAVADCGQHRTCNLTLGITDYIRASDLFAGELKNQPERRLRIIKKIAELLGEMHLAGLAHQDFYLVHLFIKPQENDALYLIDLQRTIMQKKLSRRWKIKDLAQIYFALTPHMKPEDFGLFQETYGRYFPSTASTEPCWKTVVEKAKRIEMHTRKRNL